MRKSTMADALMPPLRRGLLRLTYGAPDRWWYLSELAAALETSPSSLQRELASLSAAGILKLRPEGRRTYYAANENASMYEELRALVRKMTGIPAEVEAALEPLLQKTDLALIYGSVARQEERADSDVDLLVVADDLTLEELYRATEVAERRLQRKVNPTLYSRAEFARRRRAKNPFLDKVLRGPKIVLVGELNAGSRT
jgi:predicted nucleotidyltransferase